MPLCSRAAADVAVCAGHLEQSLVDSLRSYAPPYEDDADGAELREPAAAMQQDADVAAAERHATLTEQAQRLLHQDSPSATDLRMYNMMLTRERTVQVSAQPFPCQLLWLCIAYICSGDWYRRMRVMLSWVHERPD